MYAPTKHIKEQHNKEQHNKEQHNKEQHNKANDRLFMRKDDLTSELPSIKGQKHSIRN